MEAQLLRMGQVVEYVTVEGVTCAAIVASVTDRPGGIVNLCVFAKDGTPYSKQSVSFKGFGNREELKPDTWHWIE